MTELLDDARSLLEGSGVIFVGRIGGRGLGLLGQILLIRALSPENFGLLALGYTIVLLLARFFSVGISQGVTRFLSDTMLSERERGAAVSSAGSFIIAASGVFGIAIFFGRGVLSDIMGAPGLGDMLLIFLPVLVAFPMSRLFLGILRAEERSGAAVLSQDFLSKAIALGGFLSLSALVSSYVGAIAYWNGAAVGALLLAGYASIRHLRAMELRLVSFQSETFRSLWSFSWPLIFSTSFAILLSYVDIIMIGYFLTEQKVGLYRAIQPLRQVTLFVLTSVVFLYLPIASRYYGRGDYDSLNKLYTTATKWVTLGTFPFVVVFAMYSADVIRVFFKQAYVPAAPTLSVLIIGMFFRAIVGPTGETVKAVNQTQIEFYASLVGLVANIIANVVLIPTLGIVGAAVGATLGFAVFNVIELLAVYRATSGHPFTLNTAKPLMVSLIVAFLIWYWLRDARLGLFALVGIGIGVGLVTLLSVPLTLSLDDIDRNLLSDYWAAMVG